VSKKGDGDDGVKAVEPVSLSDLRAEKQQQRRQEALSLRLAGLPYDQIGDRLGIEADSVADLVDRSLERNVPEAEAMRRIENARLDRAQAAVWSSVLEGDMKAVDTFLKISQRRSRLNGLDAATKIDLGITVRQEMEQALKELENVVLGEVISVHDEIAREERTSIDTG
jgi:hypothetical protein